MSVVDAFPRLDIEIRDATPDDSTAIATIYAWHVLHGRASFEEVPPTAEQIAERIACVQKQDLAWLVAMYRGILVGYSYAAPYRPRHAYRYTLEESIYVDASMTGRGIGSKLLMALIQRCEEGPWRQLLAVIGDGDNNAGSLRLHKQLGFAIAGQLRSVGYKMGGWRDTIIMQRPLNEGDWTLPE